MRIVREHAGIPDTEGSIFRRQWHGWRCEIPDGQIIPFPYGIAYRDLTIRAGVCFPIPLNWLVRWAIARLGRLRFPPMDRGLDWHLRESYRVGYRDGWFASSQSGTRALEETPTETLVAILRGRAPS